MIFHLQLTGRNACPTKKGEEEVGQTFLSDIGGVIQRTKSITMKKFSFWSAIVVLSLAFGCAASKPYKDITVAELKERLERKDDLAILDVRTKEEYASETGHLAAAILLPVQELEKRYHELDSLKNKEIVAYCRSGVRSARASKFLGEKGFKVLNMLGGIKAWNQIEGESKKGEKGEE
jgi:rhodanese-related sulfurtransferase